MQKVNLLIPMAGSGSRFKEKGYSLPKPLINIFGKPMIQWVIDNFDSDLIENYIFICRTEHESDYGIKDKLNKMTGGKAKVYFVDKLTEGAACTTLLAQESIDNETPLLMANSDQFVEWNCKSFLDFCFQDIDGTILTFPSTHPKWSYAKTDEHGFVTEVAEKKPISDRATVGIYYWKKGIDYVKYANQMISKNIRTNNEFYVCPVYNEAVQDNKKVKIFDIKESDMWGLGTPEDLSVFLVNYKN